MSQHLTDFIFLIMKRIASEIQIDCLMRKLAEVDSSSEIRQADNIINFSEPEASLVINQLQEQVVTFSISLSHISIKIVPTMLLHIIHALNCNMFQIKILEMEKYLSQQNYGSVVELAEEQNIFAIKKFEEVLYN